MFLHKNYVKIKLSSLYAKRNVLYRTMAKILCLDCTFDIDFINKILYNCIDNDLCARLCAHKEEI